MHFAIERLKRDELLVSQPHTVDYCPNKLLLNTDSGDLLHLFVYKTSCYNHVHESSIQLAARWRLLFGQIFNYH